MSHVEAAVPATVSGSTSDSHAAEAVEKAQATEAAAQIDLLRGQIDSLDEAIVRLVAERSQLSARVQRARMNAGGTRVELGRERVIRNAYRTALGPEGPSLADAVLQVCRGRR